MARTYLGYTQTAANADLDAIVEAIGGIPSVAAYGAVGTGLQASAATNTTAFRAALAAAAASDAKRIYVPAGEYVLDDNLTFVGGTHDGITLFGDGPGSVLILADAPNSANVEAGWMVMLDGTALAPLRNVRITGLALDGAKGSTTWSDTSNGIVAYTDAVLENCQVDNVWTHDFLTNGIIAYTGGIRFTGIHSYNNDSHGLAVSVDNTFTDVCEVYQLTAHGNAGYGLDAGRGCRTFVRGVESYENTEGGFKYSIGTILLDIDGVHVYNNGTAGVSGPGFTDTDTTGDGIILIGSVVTHDNAGPGFRATSANTLSIGRVVSYDNDCYVASSVALYDILVGGGVLLDYFSVGYLRSENAPNSGILIDGVVHAYQIGAVECVGAQDAGFLDNTTGPTNGVLLSGIFRNNNKAATAGAAGAALQVETTGTFKALGCTFTDDQGSPTQVSGMRFTSGIKAHVDACHFGTGISATGHIYSSTAGTVVTFGNGNTGLVARASGTGTVNGGGTTATLTYGTALTNLGGVVLFPLVYPSSADAAEANYVSSVSVTETVVTCPTTFAAGAGNVAFRYDVRMEIQR